MNAIGALWRAIKSDLPSGFPTITGPLSESDLSDQFNSVLKIYTGYNESNPCTILLYEKDGSKPKFTENKATAAALNAKTIKHPDFLKFLDYCDVRSGIYIAVEKMTPLVLYSDAPCNWDFSWNIFTMINALSFLHQHAKKTHNALSPYSVYVTQDGEWKLGCLEQATDLNPQSEATDRIGLAFLICFAHQIKSGKANWNEISSQSPHSLERLVPNDLGKLIKRITSPNESLSYILETDSVFQAPLVLIQLFLRNIVLESKERINQFFVDLPPRLNSVDINARIQILKMLAISANLWASVEHSVKQEVIFAAANNIEDPDIYRQTVLNAFISPWLQENNKTSVFMTLHAANMYAFAVDDKFAIKHAGILSKCMKDNSPELRDIVVRALVHLVPKMDMHNQQNTINALMPLALKDSQTFVRQNALTALR